ncbi:MAG: ABC transporter permease [Cyclobacteriaceae bacterium]|nr:ABC transporter permease [Cyclobacteriaceae bacterium]
MVRNYIVTALRNFTKNKFFTFINIFGLSIGIACSILILLWVSNELSFDKFHPKADRLYQVWVNTDFNNTIHTWPSLPLPTHAALKTEDSNIKNTAITDRGAEHLLAVGEKKLIMNGMSVSEAFLTMFEFPLIYGDATTVLTDPTSIVITESTAKAFFGDEDPTNKMIRVDDQGELKIVGILEDIPKNSTFEFDFLLPWKYKRKMESWIVDNEDLWRGYMFPAYVELNDGSNKSDVDLSIKNVLVDHGMEDMSPELFLYPMDRWRLHSRFDNGVEKGGLSDFVQLFSLIAVFIIVIACINFINLSTARSEKRAKEVGIRKSVGSNRFNLVMQFIAESMIISFLAYILAVFIAELALPFYNNLVEKELFIDYRSWIFWSFSIAMIGVAGLVSGSYPAFYLSAFKPIKVLKGKIQVGRNANLPRKILVTLQFGFSILLIIGTIVIYQQIQLVKNRHLGYDQANLISVELNDELSKNYQVLKNELLQSGIVEATTISDCPITKVMNNQFLSWPGKPEDSEVAFANIRCRYDYTKTMGIQMLDGRDFSEDFISDSTAIIVNKAGLDLMQLDDPIGAELDLGWTKRTIIGITDDVLMESPYHDVRPMFMLLGDSYGIMSIRIKETKDLQLTLKTIGKVFNKYNSTYPFEYTFTDVAFQKKFSTINLSSKLASLFATLTIMITGLGLFGLAAYTTEQRTKEIGVRKVMGATVLSIIKLISMDFTRLVMLAFLLAAPIGWWLLNMYLDRYPIRIDIQFWIFPFTGLFALAFALSIVVTQALKAAHTNPAHSLRNE